MESLRLKQFLHESRKWSRTSRGMELAQLAADDLVKFAEADSGTFVYRRSLLTTEGLREPADVYVPWGVFQNKEGELRSLLEIAVQQMDLFYSIMERWVLTEDIPSREVKEFCEKHDVLEFGIWPLMSHERVVGAIVATRTVPPSDTLTTEMSIAVLDVCAAQLSLALDLLRTVRIVELASRHDLLTGLLNRRGFETRVDHLVEQIHREGGSVVFGIVDVDHLKQINDEYGHPSGDQALKTVARRILASVRTTDMVCRYGGDEFVVLCQTPVPESSFILKRIQSNVRSAGLSVRIGGAVWGIDGETFAECYQAADERLYANKRENKVTFKSANVPGHFMSKDLNS